MSEQNKYLFESDIIVNEYSTQDHLQNPEKTILNTLKGVLKNFRMLDIGVGGGRTTFHFGMLANEYIGIDYSKPMIDSCQKRFIGKENISFRVADVRKLDDFADQYFDFILFSFNGLDNIRHEDRLQSLRGIRRIIKNNGIFAFSTHNLNSVYKLYSFRPSRNPILTIKRFWSCVRFLLMNKFPWKMRKLNWSIINEEAYGFTVPQYYIRPSAQIEQLQDSGFGNMHLYSLDGTEISLEKINDAKDPWVYYLCSAL